MLNATTGGYESTPMAWRPGLGHPGQDPNHSTPYLDMVVPPCAAIGGFISMYAVMGVYFDWPGGFAIWRGDLEVLAGAIAVPLVLLALRHWRRWRA
jgi:hypothetical protein